MYYGHWTILVFTTVPSDLKKLDRFAIWSENLKIEPSRTPARRFRDGSRDGSETVCETVQIQKIHRDVDVACLDVIWEREMLSTCETKRLSLEILGKTNRICTDHVIFFYPLNTRSQTSVTYNPSKTTCSQHPPPQ